MASRIRPRQGKSETGTIPVDSTASFSDFVNAIAKKQPNLCPTVYSGVAPTGPGSGRGTHCDIVFNPIDYLGCTEPGKQQDEALLHEMIHAYRIVTGTMTCVPHSYLMTSVEEVIAIAITNLYALQWNRPMRNDHIYFSNLTDPEMWMKHNQKPIRDFCSQEPYLAPRLAQMCPFGFNPFRLILQPAKSSAR